MSADNTSHTLLLALLSMTIKIIVFRHMTPYIPVTVSEGHAAAIIRVE